ncbi:MAG: hypothetical protein PUB66_02160 [Oscillospiraceae bacterium]|nr:hypothetical protein [Ruminococcus sp.]MDD6097525.1 hypothetical protein [Oscillospiraceae bacterium]
MAETRFIRTVAFGGYDKSDVDKRLEAMYSKVHDLKNELTETKAVLKKYEEGSDAAKSYESVLAVERAKITQLQVKNDNLSEKIKTVRDSIKIKEDENTCLREKNAALEAEIEDLKLSLMTIQVGEDAAALGTVFVEAQKSKEMVLKSAQNEADNIKAMSEKSAEDTIADANNKAKEIIYEAEKKAAEITADALNNSEEMKTASNNLKAVLASDIFKISEYFSKLKDVLHDFEVDSSAALEQSQELLKDAEKEVNKDGIPVFRLPERIEPAYPEKPDIKPVFESEQEVKEKKRNTELDKLQAMAEAIGRSEKKSDKSTDNSTEQSDNSTDKKSESEQDTKTSSDSEKSAKKPASNNAPSLADLLKQATALNGGKN